MKIVFALILALIIVSCSNLVILPESGKIYSIKLDGSNKIIFKEGEVIYFTNLDSSGISFHYTDNDSIKTIKPKDKKLEDFVIEYDSKYANELFQPFYKQKRDSLKSPKSYITDEYNKFAEILEGKKWGSLTKYKHKKLNVKKIDWYDINDLVVDEIYYHIADSLRLIIPMPKDVVNFCEKIKTKYADAKYLFLFRNVYLTYNIFGGGEGKWVIFSRPGEPSPFVYIEGKKDVALLIAPKIVIDIDKAIILSIDVQSHFIENWEHITSEIKIIVEEEAEFYNLRF